jgi:hypothetical protein
MRRGEQVEHLARMWVLSPRVVEKDLRWALLLTLLTPAHCGVGAADRVGGPT